MSLASLSSVELVEHGLETAGYLGGAEVALVVHLAAQLGKPILVEGPAGVGKTELAKAVSRLTSRPLVRLQCYEGLGESQALYEWNYRKQLLHIQLAELAREAEIDTGDVADDLFGEPFLLERPLLRAIRSVEPVVLLIDEVDKIDQEFEALLLEVLSDFQVTIPELGTVPPETAPPSGRPLVVLTSNATRELGEALRRRCLYLYLDYPEPEREAAIVRRHVPELDDALTEKAVAVVNYIRSLDVKKAPSIAETLDWARTLVLLGARAIDEETLARTLGLLTKHRGDERMLRERIATAVRR